MVFLLRYSWGISKRLFLASAVSIVLDTVEPFALLIFPKFIIDELAGLKRWDVVLQYILLLIGVTALIRVIRLAFSVFINMSINRADMFTGMHYSRFFLSDGLFQAGGRKRSGSAAEGIAECTSQFFDL